jgi:hypothetical protein
LRKFLAFGVARGSFIYTFPKLGDSFIFLFLGEAAPGHVMLNEPSDFSPQPRVWKLSSVNQFRASQQS